MTKTKSFRLDDETWGRFLALCQRPENNTDATKVLTIFIKQCLENDSLPTSVEDIDPVSAKINALRSELITLIDSRIDSVTTSNDNQAGLGSKPTITESVETSIDSVTTVIDKADDSVDTRIDSVSTEDIESVSSSNVNPDNGTEPIQSPDHQETEEAHPPVETVTEAIAPKSESKIAASGGSGTGEGTEGAIALKSGEVDIHPQEGKKGLPFPLGMSQSELAEYWGVEASAISQEKAKSSFPQWSAKKDPEGLSWGWNGKARKEGRYFVIDKY